jgi:hypothetical protein
MTRHAYALPLGNEGCRGRDRMVIGFIYNYLCNQCLSPLKLKFEPRSWRGVLDITLCDKACQ